jgi:trehalose-6-phosphate synthase
VERCQALETYLDRHPKEQGRVTLLQIAEPSPLFTISTEARAAMHSNVGFDVSADGQRLLVPIVTSQEKSEIVVIQNWEAAAQKSRGKPN